MLDYSNPERVFRRIRNMRKSIQHELRNATKHNLSEAVVTDLENALETMKDAECKLGLELGMYDLHDVLTNPELITA